MVRGAPDRPAVPALRGLLRGHDQHVPVRRRRRGDHQRRQLQHPGHPALRRADPVPAVPLPVRHPRLGAGALQEPQPRRADPDRLVVRTRARSSSAARSASRSSSSTSASRRRSRLGSANPPAVTPVASAVAALLEELDRPGQPARQRDGRPVRRGPAAADGSRAAAWSRRSGSWSGRSTAPRSACCCSGSAARPSARAETVEATSPDIAGPELDWFAPGSFADLSDAEALNRRAFERLAGGVRFGAAGRRRRAGRHANRHGPPDPAACGRDDRGRC